MDIWLAVLSSSLISGTIGALIAGWFSLRSKGKEYENDYFKVVLDRRVNAYSAVEAFIEEASVSCVDDKNRTYHAMFEPHDDSLARFYPVLAKAMSGKFWLSDELYSTLRKINILMYPAGDSRTALLELAKQKYTELAELRSTVERVHAKDMLTLHKVEKFLRSKRQKNGYDALPNRSDA